MGKTEYGYQVGEVVNETLKIVGQTRIPNGKYTRKAYEVQSLVYSDAPKYTISEGHLKSGKGCAYKAGKRVYKGNSLYAIKKLRPYIVDISLAKKIRPQNNTIEIETKCPDCGTVKMSNVNKLYNRGFNCNYCSRDIKYPELFMMSYLDVKDIDYNYQVVMSDLKHRRFDFYTPSYGIIETHGEQHYEHSHIYNYNRTKESDNEKRTYCLSKGINLVEVDCRKSSFNFIEESIRNSDLPDIKESERKLIIDRMEVNKKYPLKYILNSYKNGKGSTNIAKELDVNHKTILSILYKYNIKVKTRKTRVKCLNTNKVFDSIEEACYYSGLKSSSGGSISAVCNGKRNYAGKHPITGEKLRWEYVDNE